MAKVSYHQLFNLKSNQQFHTGIYRKHSEAIFETYGDRMNSVHEWLRDWRAAGISIDILPADDLERISAVAPVYMQAFQLGSADAVHLAIAETVAASFLTTDTDFRRADASPIQICRTTGTSTASG